MIKKIIFDLDDTLIMWKPEYIKALDKTIKKHHIKEDKEFINNLIDSYEEHFDTYDPKILLDYINQNITEKITMEFIEDFLYHIGFCSETDEDTIDTLKYLNQKYELTVLTNWFTNAQINRLKHAKIDKYFKQIIGGEKTIKPNKESFIEACKPYKPEECIMIGDNYKIDILGAHNAGLKVIYLNKKNKENDLKFKEIKELKQLKNIL